MEERQMDRQNDEKKEKKRGWTVWGGWIGSHRSVDGREEESVGLVAERVELATWINTEEGEAASTARE